MVYVNDTKEESKTVNTEFLFYNEQKIIISFYLLMKNWSFHLRKTISREKEPFGKSPWFENKKDENKLIEIIILLA